MRFLSIVFCLAAACFPLSGKAIAASVPLTSGMKITGNTVVQPGAYRLTDAGTGIVQVSGSGFTVDFQGAKIVGPGKSQGVGIHITDARNVTVKNADVSGCLWGIVVERSIGVRLEHCVTSRNADLPPGTIIDESGQEPEDNHGGGILLRDSRTCLVQRCTSQYQWDGIDVIRSERNVIEDGDTSYNGNWGIHLWDSSRNVFRRNRAVWCTTGAGTLYQALTGWQTYDSQAVGIDHNSNENIIEGNDLRFGGDGIFIRANEGPIAPGTVVPPKNGSHRNILRDNDCSFSPNNAIEVDLVDDTVIEGNNCSNSHYGMWLGYSRRCLVRRNTCLNDTAHAVEIENGQGDVFANNVFGFDTSRPDVALIYLRQNGRDKTPSGPYTLTDNLFYGTAKSVQLRATTATLRGNTLFWRGLQKPQLVFGDAASKAVEEGNDITALASVSEQMPPAAPPLKTARPGSRRDWKIADARLEATPPVVEADGIPVWVQGQSEDTVPLRIPADGNGHYREGRRLRSQDTVHLWIPADFWDQPAKQDVKLSLFGGKKTVWTTLPLAWPADRPRIDGITPNPARLGEPVTLTGVNLTGGRMLFNGKPVRVLQSSPSKWVVALPEGIVAPTGMNILFERGTGANQQRTWPISFVVQVPSEQMPHLLSAAFSPTTLHVGDLLKVTFTVRNNLPTPAPLMTVPKPPFTYDEKQSWDEVGVQETPGTLHLRVTSDHPAGHDSGSWPWLFGFSQARLAPGEATTVTGFIRVRTPGEHEFRVGLVATGARFIDDNAFRTKITVLP